jgi:DNA repair protein SbcC/Rad50
VNDVPLRSIFISDFRRLEGHRILPLDAPIVLIHGPNGTGKTSVLSAIELALTGDIRSMRRHDARYTAHLPFQGQEFATLRIDVSDDLAASLEPITMTVGGSRIDGAPRLNQESAEFYAERCYLDQVSLGQLLELYQYRVGKEESALARFVNELLGLEQLDALRVGLADSMDFRLLKKLSDPLSEADAEAKKANTDLSVAAKALESARSDLRQSQEALAGALESLGLEMPVDKQQEHQEITLRAKELLRARRPTDDMSTATESNHLLTILRGRIETLSNRPAVRRLEDARAAIETASARLDAWRTEHQAGIEAWRADMADLEIRVKDSEAVALQDELKRIERTIAKQVETGANRARVEERIAERRATLLECQALLSAAQAQAGSLVEGLAALREEASDNFCPVCDRDFSEVSATHLTVHIDGKLLELTQQGARLRELREQRDAIAAEVQSDEQMLDEFNGVILTEILRAKLDSRRVAVADLLERHKALLPAIRLGDDLRSQSRRAQVDVDELEAMSNETEAARTELDQLARALGVPVPNPVQSLQQSWRELADVSTARLRSLEAFQQRHAIATDYLEQCRRGDQRVTDCKEIVAEAAERKNFWDTRVDEAKRLQAVARAVHEASSQARSAIVQRVFSESLNDVWRSVFTRLAPQEPYVPAFGIPTSSKTALELTLETVHTSGASGGSPQMMLSAGNLNTAALSLFIALHLAVEPLVPCLVFDDPVQSMDEVHVAQFAALVRTLSKRHKRQVIIAVHERELFQYLALELSPAFEGDELITIELGERSEDEDRGISRSTWAPDPSIAV